MQTSVDYRIARILAHRKLERATSLEPSSEDNPNRDRRLARDKVVAELPRFASRLSSVVAELNDQIFEGDIWIKLQIADQIPSAEAVYTLGVVGRRDLGPELSITIDYTGRVRSMLRNDHARSLLACTTVFSVGRDELIGLLLVLLEAQFSEGHSSVPEGPLGASEVSS